MAENKYHFTGSQRLAQQVYTALCQSGKLGYSPELVDIIWSPAKSFEREVAYKHSGNVDALITLMGYDKHDATRWYVNKISIVRNGVSEVVAVPVINSISQLKERALRQIQECDAMIALHFLTSRGFIFRETK